MDEYYKRIITEAIRKKEITKRYHKSTEFYKELKKALEDSIYETAVYYYEQGLKDQKKEDHKTIRHLEMELRRSNQTRA